MQKDLSGESGTERKVERKISKFVVLQDFNDIFSFAAYLARTALLAGANAAAVLSNAMNATMTCMIGDKYTNMWGNAVKFDVVAPKIPMKKHDVSFGDV